MAELIDDLLNLSHLSREAMHRERVDLTAMAREVGAELQRANPGRTVELVLAPALTADADARMLQVVLSNLLGNAWKFTGKRDGAKIEVGAVDQDGGASGMGILPMSEGLAQTHGRDARATAGQRVFCVRDNGVGFDMAYADKLFGAFQRLHSVQEFEGNGIGLALVQRIVRRHGGRVWAEGAVGQGATFYFTLGKNAGAETP
jgi:signal transduction histidine kinase